MWAECCDKDGPEGRALRLRLTWVVASGEMTQLGSFHLGKYLWKVADLKKANGEVPNILKSICLVFWFVGLKDRFSRFVID